MGWFGVGECPVGDRLAGAQESIVFLAQSSDVLT